MRVRGSDMQLSTGNEKLIDKASMVSEREISELRARVNELTGDRGKIIERCRHLEELLASAKSPCEKAETAHVEMPELVTNKALSCFSEIKKNAVRKYKNERRRLAVTLFIRSRGTFGERYRKVATGMVLAGYPLGWESVKKILRGEM